MTQLPVPWCALDGAVWCVARTPLSLFGVHNFVGAAQRGGLLVRCGEDFC